MLQRPTLHQQLHIEIREWTKIVQKIKKNRALENTKNRNCTRGEDLSGGITKSPGILPSRLSASDPTSSEILEKKKP